MPPMPRQPAPPLDLPLAGGGRFNLADSRPARFTLLLFYRGYHCQRCRKSLGEINAMMDDFARAGTAVVAVSTDDRERAEKSKAEWDVDRVPVAYGLTVENAKEWGLYVSRAIKPHEAPVFNEPGLFLIEADGTVNVVVVNSMQRLRPYPKDILATVERLIESGDPPRGEV